MTQNRQWVGKPRPGRPFSRPIAVDDVPETGLELEITATTAECDAVAAESRLPAVAALSAKLRIARRGGRRYEVSGDLAARITQVCVVTLEPFESDVAQAIELSFVDVGDTGPKPKPSSRRRGAASEAKPPQMAPVQGALEDDPPDQISDGTIDLGAIAFEFLMLARDLYPRKPGVAFTDVVVGDADDEPSAFAALQRLKDRP